MVQVQDDGIGVPDYIKENFFAPEPGHRRIGTQNEPSTGIGLLLVREMVTRNAGRISVESEVGVGTEVTLVLPISEPQS